MSKGDTRPAAPAYWIVGESPDDSGKRSAPAAGRNRDPIMKVLAEALPASGTALEIASGSGEHAVHFARSFPALRWIPSDVDPAARSSIMAWREEAGLGNLAPPLPIDASDGRTWTIDAADAIVCINMVHISPWAVTEGLLSGAARLLPPGGLLYLYGPFFRRGVEIPHSNKAFDESLRSRNRAWGVRWVHDVDAAARSQGLVLTRIVEMPANNLSLIFNRE